MAFSFGNNVVDGFAPKWDAPEYDGTTSRYRLEQLQGLCGPSQRFDALLIIGGQDSTYNKLSQALISYLLLGGCGAELQGQIYLKEKDEVLEDCVLVIRESTVEIFYNFKAKKRLVPLMAKWRNLTEHQVLAHEMNDADVAEMCKIQSFIKMVSNCARIGVPVKDPMEVENWPLVQAFGIEGVGPGGFFTMRHDVIDCCSEVDQLISDVEQFGVAHLMKKYVPMLEHHFNSFTSELDRYETASSRDAVTGMVLGDSLSTYYEYGKIRASSEGDEAEPGRGSRVLLGLHTGAANDESNGKSIAESGVGGAPALHLTVDAECPSTGIRASRSYFLSHGKGSAIPKPGDEKLVAEEAKGTEGGRRDSADSVLLLRSYQQLLLAQRAAARAYSRSRSVGEARRAAGGGTELELEVVVDDFNITGGAMKPSHGNGLFLAFVRVSVNDVTSVCAPATSLGRLVVGDTFLMSVSGAVCSVLTGGLPPCRHWGSSGYEEDKAAELCMMLRDSHALQNELQLGARTDIEVLGNARVLFGLPFLAVEAGTLRVYETGFAFLNNALNPVVVSLPLHVKSIELAAGGIGGTSVLVIEYKSATDNPSCAALPYDAPMSHLGIALGPQSDVRRQVLEALEIFSAACNRYEIPFSATTSAHYELPAALSAGVAMVQADYRDALVAELVQACMAEQDAASKPTLLAGGGETGADTSSAKASRPVPADTSEVPAEAVGSGVPVTVLVGVPGSGVVECAAQVRDQSSGSIKWSVLHLTDTTLGELKQRLTDALDGVSDGSSGRVMLVVAAHADTRELLATIRSLPGCYPAAVTACVNCVHLYQDERRTAFLPMLLDQIAEGAASTVVVSSVARVDAEEYQSFRRRLRETNPRAEVYRVNYSSIGGQDLDTILSVNGPNAASDSSGSSAERGGRAVETVSVSVPGKVVASRFVDYMKALLPQSKIDTRKLPTPGSGDGAKGAGGLRLAQKLARQKVLSLFELDLSVDGEEAKALAQQTTDGGACWCVSGLIKFTDGPGRYCYTGTLFGSSLREASGEDLKAWGSPQGEQSLFAVSGARLSGATLGAYLRLCQAPQRTELPPRTIENVTTDERAKIQKDRFNHELPEGWYYDGHRYVSHDQNANTHPYLDRFVQEFVDSENRKIKDYNAAVRAEATSSGSHK